MWTRAAFCPRALTLTCVFENRNKRILSVGFLFDMTNLFLCAASSNVDLNDEFEREHAFSEGTTKWFESTNLTLNQIYWSESSVLFIKGFNEESHNKNLIKVLHSLRSKTTFKQKSSVYWVLIIVYDMMKKRSKTYFKSYSIFWIYAHSKSELASADNRNIKFICIYLHILYVSS